MDEQFEMLRKVALKTSRLSQCNMTCTDLIRSFDALHDKSILGITDAMMQGMKKSSISQNENPPSRQEEMEHFLDLISMKKHASSKTGSLLKVRPSVVTAWAAEQRNLAIVVRISSDKNKTGLMKKVLIEKYGDLDRPEYIGAFLLEDTSDDHFFLLEFIHACHAKPLDLVVPAHIFKRESNFPQVLQPKASFYFKDSAFRATMAVDKEFPDIDKVFLHTIPISSEFASSGAKIEEWILAVYNAVRFRKISDGFQIAFAASTLHVVSSWASANYAMTDSFLKQFQSCQQKGGLKGLMVDWDLPTFERKEVEWLALRNAFERKSGWICIGPGSFRFRKPQRDWKSGHGPGESWISKSTSATDGQPVVSYKGPLAAGNWTMQQSGAGVLLKQKPSRLIVQTNLLRMSVAPFRLLLDPSKKICSRDLPSIGKYIPDNGLSEWGKGSYDSNYQPGGHWPCTDHDFVKLKSVTFKRSELDKRTLKNFRMRLSGGSIDSGRVRMYFRVGSVQEFERYNVHSLCTVIAGRDAPDIHVPAAVAGAIVLLVISTKQWRTSRNQYVSVLGARQSAEHGWWGVAVADDALLPPEGGNVSHRRLLSLRLAMLLRGVGSASCAVEAIDPVPIVQWKQWVQVNIPAYSLFGLAWCYVRCLNLRKNLD